jgi:hypothetical protein
MAAESQRAVPAWRRVLPALTLLGLIAAGWHAAVVTAAERAERAVLVVADENSFLALLGAPPPSRQAANALAAFALRAGGAAVDLPPLAGPGGGGLPPAAPPSALAASVTVSAAGPSAASATGSAARASRDVAAGSSARGRQARRGSGTPGPGAPVTLRMRTLAAAAGPAPAAVALAAQDPSAASAAGTSSATPAASGSGASATGGGYGAPAQGAGAVGRAVAAIPTLQPETLLQRLKAAGVGALGVSESGIGTLEAAGSVAMVSGATWQSRVQAGLAPSPAFPLNPQATYLLVAGHSVAVWLRGVLPQVLGPKVPVHWYAGPEGIRIAEVPVAGWLLGEEPLGFSPGSFLLARRAGLAIVPRPANSVTGLSPTAALQLYRRIAGAGASVATVIFSGGTTQPIPGASVASTRIAPFFRTHHWILGVVRLSGNIDLLAPGMGRLADALPGQVVRVYSVPALASFTPAETRRLAQDIRIADARVVYVHPVVGSADPVASSLAYVASLTHALRAQGLEVASRPAVLPPLSVGRLQRFVQAVAAAAGLAWLLVLWMPGIRERRLLAAGGVALVVLGGAALLPGMAAAGLVAGVGALVSAGLGAAAATRLWRVDGVRAAGSPDPWRLGREAAAAGLALAGGFAAGGFFSAMATLDTRSLLGWPVPTGLGLVHLAAVPLALAAFVAWVGPGAPGWALLWQRFVHWAERPVTITLRDTAVVLVALAVVFVLRHKGLDLWVYDVRAPWRVLMTRYLLAPPSERAVLLGFPAALALAWCARWGWRWWFLLALAVAAFGMEPFFDVFAVGQVPFPATLLGAVLQAVLGLVAAAVLLALALGAGDLWRRRRLPAADALSSAAATVRAGQP